MEGGDSFVEMVLFKHNFRFPTPLSLVEDYWKERMARRIAEGDTGLRRKNNARLPVYENLPGADISKYLSVNNKLSRKMMD